MVEVQLRNEIVTAACDLFVPDGGGEAQHGKMEAGGRGHVAKKSDKGDHTGWMGVLVFFRKTPSIRMKE
jgi:hypothetical protein